MTKREIQKKKKSNQNQIKRSSPPPYNTFPSPLESETASGHLGPQARLEASLACLPRRFGSSSPSFRTTEAAFDGATVSSLQPTLVGFQP